jgi:hypothetical protein
MKSSSIFLTYQNLIRIQRWMEAKMARDRDWPADMFSLKYYEGYISHAKPEHLDPNGQMLEGGEEHNISKTNPIQRCNTSIFTWSFDFLLSRYSLSLSVGHPRYFQHNFAIYIANLSIFTKTLLCQVWVPFSFNQMPFLSLFLKYHVKNISL